MILMDIINECIDRCRIPIGRWGSAESQLMRAYLTLRLISIGFNKVYSDTTLWISHLNKLFEWTKWPKSIKAWPIRLLNVKPVNEPAQKHTPQSSNYHYRRTYRKIVSFFLTIIHPITWLLANPRVWVWGQDYHNQRGHVSRCVH